ncbi:MAG: hypothetical protein GY811_30280 [Myxococcales bacterium]|nr:hypothetical protein [Myxococcales bacterium]
MRTLESCGDAVDAAQDTADADLGERLAFSLCSEIPQAIAGPLIATSVAFWLKLL